MMKKPRDLRAVVQMAKSEKLLDGKKWQIDGNADNDQMGKRQRRIPQSLRSPAKTLSRGCLPSSDCWSRPGSRIAAIAGQGSMLRLKTRDTKWQTQIRNSEKIPTRLPAGMKSE